jgi:hypothetical protein
MAGGGAQTWSAERRRSAVADRTQEAGERREVGVGVGIGISVETCRIRRRRMRSPEPSRRKLIAEG